MKFLHTADWQIGMKAVQLGARADQVRQARLAAARRVADLAKSRNVDFVLVAGDTFEHHGVKLNTIREVARILGQLPCPVYLIPGNHDPAGVTGSVWEESVWSEYTNLHILHSAEPVAIPGGMLFPCPVTEAYSSSDPTEWIAAVETEGIRIGMAHGSVDSVPDRDHSYPIARDAAELARLDYLALGHYHSQALYRNAAGVVRMAYSGTHEATSFGERDMGMVLLVEIPQAGAPASVEARETGSLRWVQVYRKVTMPAELSALREELENLPSPEQTLVDCAVEGTLFAEAQEEAARLEELMASRFLFGRLDQKLLLMDPSDRGWIEDLPPGYVRKAVEQLWQAAAADGASAADQQALRDFALMWREVRQ